jgi:hypothetical protein
MLFDSTCAFRQHEWRESSRFQSEKCDSSALSTLRLTHTLKTPDLSLPAASVMSMMTMWWWGQKDEVIT